MRLYMINLAEVRTQSLTPLRENRCRAGQVDGGLVGSSTGRLPFARRARDTSASSLANIPPPFMSRLYLPSILLLAGCATAGTVASSRNELSRTHAPAATESAI